MDSDLPNSSGSSQDLDLIAATEGFDKMNLNDILNILIPAEVTEHVFKQLDNESRCVARLVCKKWQELIDPIQEWNPILFDNEAEEIRKFAAKGYPINILSVSKLQNYLYPEEGFKFKDVRRLEFLPFSEGMSEERRKDYSGISETNLKTLLNDLKDVVRSIRLHSRAFNDIDISTNPLKTCVFSKLEELVISTWNKDGPGYLISLGSLENSFPSLSKLRVSLFYDIGNEDEDDEDEGDFVPNFAQPPPHPPKYRELYEFIIRHKETLRDVYLDYGCDTNPHPLLISMDHNIPMPDFVRIMSELSFVKLTKLSLTLTPYEGRQRFLFGITLLSAQTTLTSLKIVNLSTWNKVLWTTIQLVIEKCSTTLEKILCNGCFCPSEDLTQRDEFSCTIMKNCNKLQNLQINICGMHMTNIQELPTGIKILDLGMELSREKIDYVSANFKELQEWHLLQIAAKQPNLSIPKVTLKIFRSLLEMPKLEKLILFKEFSEWAKIKRVVNRKNGLCIGPYFKEDRNPEIVDVLIDRKVFK